MIEAEPDKLGGLIDPPADRLLIERRHEPADSLFTGRSSRQGGDQEEDDVELESLAVDVALGCGLES